MSSDILELPEFEIVKELKSNEGYRIFVVEKKDEPKHCMKCGFCISDNDPPFKKHDTRKRQVKDISIRGDKILIDVKQRRYKCYACDSVFTEYLESIERDDKVTSRLFEFVGKQALNRSFLEIAVEHGISNDTVKRAFLKQINELDKQARLIAPECLGIDEVYLTVPGFKRKQPFAIFTDIKNRRVIDLIDGNTKEIVSNFIQVMRGYQDIKVVSMDMNSGYRNAVLECCKKAFTVIDRFHVMQKFNMALDGIRAEIQGKLKEGDKKDLFNVRRLITSNRENLTDEAQLAKLDTELEKYPKLKLAYEAKEKLREVYMCETKKEAYGKYYEWEQTITKDMKEVKGIQKMINRLKDQVFAYFDGRHTNAYTEGSNSLIRRIERDGNGYSFEVLRGKILYGTPASRHEKVKITDMNFYEVYPFSLDDSDYDNIKFIPEYMHDVDVYYADIDELIAYMDSGRF